MRISLDISKKKVSTLTQRSFAGLRHVALILATTISLVLLIGMSYGAGIVALAASLPAVVSFGANPTSISAGQSSTLSWIVSNATSVTIDNGVGTVVGTTSATVHPAATTTYHLTATNSQGSATAQATVIVTGSTTPPTVPAGLAGSAVSSSQVNLSWAASTDPAYAASQLTYNCYRNGTRFTTTAAGITTCSDTGLTASTAYTYAVSAQDPAGNVSALSASVQITTQAPSVIIVSFAANPWSITAGQSAVLSWAASNATSYTINNGVGAVTGGATAVSVHPTVTTTYTLTASNSQGSATAQATVTVTGSTTPPTVPTGLAGSALSSSQVNLSWTASTDPAYAASQLTYNCYRNGTRFTTTAAGVTACSDTGLTASTAYTYTVSAQDPAGNVSAQSASVQVTTKAPSVVILSFAANPWSITAGQSAVLSWAATNATSYSIDNGVGVVAGGATAVSVHPTVTTTYTLTASSSQGSATAQATVTVTGSTTPPTVPTGLAGSAVSSSQVNLSWAASTDSAYAASQLTYNCYRNGTRFTTTAAGVTACSDTGLTASTAYTYTVSAQDPAGNVSAQSASVQVTTQSLAVSITTFTASPASISAGQSSTLSWVVSNATSITIDNGVGTVTGTTSATVHPAATTTYHLTATNSQGSATAQATVTVTPSTTPPTVPTGLAGSAASSSQVNLSWAASTDPAYAASQLTYNCYRNGTRFTTTAAGITTCSDTGLTASTAYTYTVSAQDPTGNVSALSASVQVTTQASSVVILSFSPNPWSITAGQSAVLSWAATNATSYSIDNGVGVVAGGATAVSVHPTVTTTYTLTASSSQGSATAQATVTVTGSTTPPTVPTGLAGSAVSSSQVNLSWAASTDSAYAASQLTYNCYRNGTRFTTTAAGVTACSDTGLTASTAYTYTVSAQDPAGNVSAQSASVQVTTQSLAVSITTFTASPASISAGQSSTLSWVVSNATSITIDNGVGTVTGTTSATVHPAATTTYHLTATNSQGSATAQTTVTINADTTPPTVPSGLVASAASSSQINLSWNASTDNVGVMGYRVYRNGSLIATAGATSYSDTGLAASTTYTYTVAAFDAAGNASAQSSPVTAATSAVADTQPPSVSISSPTNGTSVSGSITITANASDNVAVASVQFYVDGVALGSQITTAPYAITWNSTQVSNGSHVLTAVARDAAGNSTTSSGVTVTVNNTTSNKPYGTNFPLTENPISENNNWINGLATGLDWGNVQTTPGLAIGTTLSIGPPYNDSTAVLSGAWGPNQTVQATVHTVNQNSSIFEEVELRLRTTITAHSITGYEIDFRCTSDGSQYVQIVRWNGPINSFTYVYGTTGPGLHNGDVLMATINGSTITVYINGTQIEQGTDSTFTNGSPGMGFYLQSATSTSVLGDYGFTSFSASDGTTTDTTPPSTPTNVSAVGVSSSQINLSWTASTDNVLVTGYKIFRNNVQVGTSATNSYSDTGLSSNMQYSYSVAAYDAAGNVSGQSLPVTGTTIAVDTTPPSVPSGLQTSNVGQTSLTLSWTASIDNVGVAGYQVFRNGTQVGTTTSTSYNDTGLSASTTYDYSVAAFDASNNVSSQSPQIAVTTAAATHSAPTFVQMSQTVISSGATEPIAFNSATTKGNTIVAYVIWSNNASATVTDSQGNTFTSVSAPLAWGSGYSAQIFYATNIAGGADTVTATFRNSVSYFANIYVHEYAGISTANPVDVTVAATGSSASLNSGSATTTSANDLIFGAGVSDNSVTAAGVGFTPRSFASGNVTEDQVAATVGSYAATATQDGNVWGMQMVAFRSGN